MHRRAGRLVGAASAQARRSSYDVVAVLDDFKVAKAEQDELLNILAPLEGEIVEVISPQVGTPLSSVFESAPPLK